MFSLLLLFMYMACDSVSGLITPRDLVGRGMTFRNHTAKVFVFGLDHTLWPFSTDTQVAMPLFKKVGQTVVVDAANQELKLYPHVRHILNTLKLKNIKAVATTRSPEVSGTETLLKLLDIKQYFSEVIIHPSPKIWHLVWLNNKTLIPFEDMLFFDDEIVNVRYGERLGVVSVLCPMGLYIDDFQRGLDNFQLRTTGEILPDEISEALQRKTMSVAAPPKAAIRKPRKNRKSKFSFSRFRKWKQFDI